MGIARAKLNVAYFNGSLLVSALLGLLAGSWAVFWIAPAATIGGGVYGGEIRPTAGVRVLRTTCNSRWSYDGLGKGVIVCARALGDDAGAV